MDAPISIGECVAMSADLAVSGLVHPAKQLEKLDLPRWRQCQFWLVRKNPAASSAVVRVSTFAVPRPVKKPLVELTSPPPSDFCSITTPIKARTSMRWMTIMTLIMDDFRLPPAFI